MSKRLQPDSHWNYRLVTYFDTSTYTRFFSIRECYYKKGVLDSYSEKENNFFTWEEIDDVLGTFLNLQAAFKKPVIDLDNFPNEWPHMPRIVMRGTPEERERVAQILRDGITYSGQVGDFVIHGAIDELIKWRDECVRRPRKTGPKSRLKVEQNPTCSE